MGTKKTIIFWSIAFLLIMNSVFFNYYITEAYRPFSSPITISPQPEVIEPDVQISDFEQNAARQQPPR